jgi:hypothetical protein
MRVITFFNDYSQRNVHTFVGGKPCFLKTLLKFKV